MTSNEPKVTRTLVRGLRVLECFAERNGRGPGLSLTQVATRSEMDKATVLRLLNTLCVAGYLRREEASGQYTLTAKVLQLSQGISWYQALKEQAKPHLIDLRDDGGEVVHLGVIEEGRVVYIDKLEANQSVKLVSAIGQDMPVNSTALGKAIMAYRVIVGGEPLSAFSDRFEHRTANSLVDEDRLCSELERTVYRGFSIDDNENQEGVVCVGAPIFDAGGNAIAALSVSGPEFRMRERIEWLGPRCRLSADEITAALNTY